MANLHNRNPQNREGNSNDPAPIHNHVDPNATPYRDGYVHGRVNERRLNEEGLEVRDNNTAARALLIGIALTSLVGLTLGALFFWNQRQEVITPVAVPVPAAPKPQASQSPSQTTIIERTIDRGTQVVPAPQSPASAPQSAPAPRVNINVPSQPAPAPKESRTNVNVTVPNSSPAPAPRQDTTVNVTPPQAPSSPKSDSSSSTNSRNSPSTTTNPSSSTQTAPSTTQNQGSTSSGIASPSGSNSTSGTSTGTGSSSGTSSNP
jgi:hypothetical protein